MNEVGNTPAPRTRASVWAIVCAAVATVVVLAGGVYLWKSQAASLSRLAQQQTELREAERQIAQLKDAPFGEECHSDFCPDAGTNDGGRRRLGTFIPYPSVNGPLYTTNGTPSSGAGVFGPRVSGWEPIGADKICLAGSGSPQVIATFANPLANGENGSFDVNLDVEPDAGPLTPAAWSHCIRRFHGANVNGTFQTGAGATTDTSTYADWGGLEASGSCSIFVDAGAAGQLMTVGVQATIPNAACIYYGLSAQRDLPAYWQNLSIDAVTPNSTTITVASPTTIYVQGTHDINATTSSAIQFVNGGTTYSLTSVGPCYGASTNCAQGTLAAGTYAAGTYNVVLTTAAGVFTLTSGFSFTNASISYVYPDTLKAGASTTVHIHGAGLSGAPNPTVCGATCTITSNTATDITCTGPSSLSSSGTACDVVAAGATASGAIRAIQSSCLQNNWDATPCITNAACAGLGLTLNSGAVSALADYQGGVNQTQGTGANQPGGTTTGYNGSSGASSLTAISFTSATQWLDAALSTQAPPIEVCLISDAPTSTGPFVLFTATTSGFLQAYMQSSQVNWYDNASFITSSTFTSSTPNAMCLLENGASSHVIEAPLGGSVSTIASGTITGGTGFTGSFQIGASHSNTQGNNGGHVLQVLTYTCAPSSGDETIAINYLKSK